MVKVELEEIAVSGDENQFLALLKSEDVRWREVAKEVKVQLD